MKHGTALAMFAVGAILAYAVTWSPDFLDLQTAGVIVMLTGLLGLAVTVGFEVLRRRPPAPPPRAPEPRVPADEARTRVMRRRG